MKTLLKLFAVAAALGLAPAAASAQATPPPAATAPATSAPAATPTAAPTAAPTTPGAAARAPAAGAPPAAPAAAAPVFSNLPATPGIGQPTEHIGLQQQFTPIGEEAAGFHNMILMPVITIISLFVLGLLLWVVVRYRRAANPNPARTSHNTTLEIVWTLLPVIILVAIAIPSIRLLAHQYSPPRADLTVKITGMQWQWQYEYPDNGIQFISHINTDEEDRASGDPRQFGVNHRMVVPAGAVVKLIVTSNDVVHSWGVPSFWVKMDAVPGRLNETWFRVDRPGVYYGVCYELCGADHGFMPIAVEVLPPADFARWVASQGGHMAGARPAAPAAGPTIAANEGTASTPAPSNTVQAATPAAAPVLAHESSQTN
jgi:cytochrome c oxidase subunit II